LRISWTNRRFDNIKMDGATVKITKCTVYRGGYTVKLMKLKLQNPSLARDHSKALGGEGPSNVFTWPYVFVKFHKCEIF